MPALAPAREKITSQEIPRGYHGTRKTIEQMAALVDKYSKDVRIRRLAIQIVNGVRERDHRGEVEAIFAWVKNNIRFVQDPYGREWVQSPVKTLEFEAGDCDDISVLAGALVRSIGYNTAFKTIKADKRIPQEFSHVYLMVDIDGRWVAADASQKRPLGWEPPRRWGEKMWGYVGGRFGMVKGNRSRLIGGLGMLSAKAIKQAFLGRKRKAVKAPAPQPVKAPAVKPATASAPVYGQTSLAPAPQSAQLFQPVVRAARDRQITPAAKPILDDDTLIAPRRREPDFFNEPKGEPFDPDTYDYYGDYRDQGAGSYRFTPAEMVFATGEQILEYDPLPDIANANYGDYHRDDRRFGGRTRMRVYPKTENAIKDGTPDLDGGVV